MFQNNVLYGLVQLGALVLDTDNKKTKKVVPWVWALRLGVCPHWFPPMSRVLKRALAMFDGGIRADG